MYEGFEEKKQKISRFTTVLSQMLEAYMVDGHFLNAGAINVKVMQPDSKRALPFKAYDAV